MDKPNPPENPPRPPASTDRRTVLKTGTAAVGGILLGGTSLTSAQEPDDVILEGTIHSHDDAPIPDARVAVPLRNESPYVRLDEDGYFETSVPPDTRVRLGFYKSSSDEFLAPRLDGVPHIHTLEPIVVPEEGYSLGTYRLPEAHRFEARAVSAENPDGVEGAIPRFGSLQNGSYFASGYSYTTTDENGYMKLIDAEFTGVEMAGDTRLWLYPPGYESSEEQDQSEFAPYRAETIREVDVTEDTTIEVDITRHQDVEAPPPTYGLTLANDGSTYAVGFPGPVVGTLEDVFVSGMDGVEAVYRFDAASNRWVLLHGDDFEDRPDPLDALVVLTAGGAGPETIALEIEFAGDDPAAPTARDLEEGWAFTAASTFEDAQTVFDRGSADVTVVLDSFTAPAVDDVAAGDSFLAQRGAPHYDLGDENPPVVNPFNGYFVFVTAEGSLPSLLTDVATREEADSALNAPTSS